MSRVSVVVDYDHGKESGFEQLLAVHQMRRGLERGAAAILVLREARMAVSHSSRAAAARRVPSIIGRPLPSPA